MLDDGPAYADYNDRILKTLEQKNKKQKNKNTNKLNLG